jgi:hypothetical protein
VVGRRLRQLLAVGTDAVGTAPRLDLRLLLTLVRIAP